MIIHVFICIPILSTRFIRTYKYNVTYIVKRDSRIVFKLVCGEKKKKIKEIQKKKKRTCTGRITTAFETKVPGDLTVRVYRIYVFYTKYFHRNASYKCINSKLTSWSHYSDVLSQPVAYYNKIYKKRKKRSRP